MIIDGLSLSPEELMKALRFALRMRASGDDIEVILANSYDAARVKAFLKMSGLQVQTLKNHGRWNVRGHGVSCGCG